MDNTTKIVTMLDALAEMQAERDLLASDKQRMIEDAISPAEVVKALADEAEFAMKGEGLQANITELDAAVKAQVLAHGDKVRGMHLQAVWTKGRVSWDTKALDGYAAAHPEIAQFRTTGEPSVSIRKVQ